ncbi:MAG TPA: sialidase family protein [Blastocatellia bacterium]|nr:sialidase family protein [Blastocatellia bacterium]
MMQIFRAACAWLFIAILLTSGITAQEGATTVRRLDTPAGPSSGAPNLFTAPDGRVFLSWIEKISDNRHALRFSVREKAAWSAPRTIAEGGNWFVNWADFPSMFALADGTLAAHWLAKSGVGTYAYDVKISLSTDGGKTWSKPVTPHRDNTQTEHGFVSMFASPGKRVGAVWLDGRKFTSKEGSHGHGASTDEMTLHHTTISADGKLSEEVLLDGRVCECCQTSAAQTSEGVVVVYRDRSEKEIRDISIVRFAGGRWTAPQTVHSDGWEIQGCPVNGPSVAADDRRVAVAWFTATKDVPRVKVAFSQDAGASFSQPVQVDDGSPLGRVETLILADGSAFVAWLERAEKGAEVRARRIHPDGTREKSIIITESSPARSSGFPQLARSGNEIIFAWTEPGTVSRVQTAMLVVRSQKP